MLENPHTFLVKTGSYYQWYYNIPSAEVLKKVPLGFLKKAYCGLHDLELDLAVQKVGES